HIQSVERSAAARSASDRSAARLWKLADHFPPSAVEWRILDDGDHSESRAAGVVYPTRQCCARCGARVVTVDCRAAHVLGSGGEFRARPLRPLASAHRSLLAPNTRRRAGAVALCNGFNRRVLAPPPVVAQNPRSGRPGRSLFDCEVLRYPDRRSRFRLNGDERSYRPPFSAFVEDRCGTDYRYGDRLG